jgi:YVTN family beta-propeller protein
MKTKHLLVASFAITVAISACKKDEPQPETPTPTTSAYESGVFVTNEGPFSNGSGTISYFDKTNSTVSNDIFQSKNGYPLGSIVQSMAIYNSKGYIVVNNAGKVEIVDAGTFASVGVVSGLNSPRCFLGVNSTTGYVSEWGADNMTGAVKVVNLSTNTVTSTIATGKGAENMLKVGNKVYVACGGGFGNDSVVTVIDALTNMVTGTIDVGANPKSLQVDANGKIWVLCAGKFALDFSLEQSGSLVRINPTDNSIELDFPLTSTYSQPFHLVINAAKTSLYYTFDSKVYTQSVNSSTLNTTAVISRNFYSLGIDAANDYIYGGNAGNFSANGNVLRYNASGTVVDSFAVGIIPGGFCFKN